MEIKTIKEQLPITVVLAHYGLQPDKHHRLLCPFHNDRTPSLQIYPKTNTFCCFSSNCSAGTGDVIEFIRLKEHCTKHEAILKAQALIGAPAIAVPASAAKLFVATGELDKIAVVAKVFSYFKRSLPLSKKAVEYLQGRSIDYAKHEMGYNSGGLHAESKNHHLLGSMVQWGLLKPRPAGGYSVWAKDCVIFPLKNRDGHIVSLYGRSITNDEDSRHFYLTGREGLYPGYPNSSTTKLILTESIIDAVSLLQQPAIAAGYTILSLYGTNGLTEEHTGAITGLPQLEEIIFMLNADEAGRTATRKHYETLHALMPRVRMTRVPLPEAEDVNSVLQTHADAEVLEHLIEGRTDFFLSVENKNDEPSTTVATPALQPEGELITTNAELLLYKSGEVLITVLGGIKVTGLDRLRVTLKVEHSTKQTLPIRHHLDLYHHPHTEQLINQIADRFDISVQVITTMIAELTGALESYRTLRMEQLQAKPKERPELSPAERQTAIKELQHPQLLKHINHLIGESGIVGEYTSRLIAWVVFTSRKRKMPLHVMFLGTSGSGKTYLQERVSALVPPEDRIEITQVTENAFYYFGREDLKYKLVLIEDLDGAESSLYPIRELQSKQRISKTVTLKDTKGNLKTVTLVVEGPVSVSGCTTREKLYEDNANRCLLIYIDGSKEQDQKIMEYQTRLSAGMIDRTHEEAIRQLLQNMQRVLRPLTVINPYARHIQLPEQIFKPRRTMTLLLSFIETITFIHQYQREIKKDAEGKPYIETTPTDIETALVMLKEVLFSKGDELAHATRIFLEQLKARLGAEGKTSFTSKEIRTQLRIHPSSLKRYLIELERYGYIRSSGNRYRSYEYSITNYGEYDALKSSIDQHLAGVVAAIKDKAGGSVVQ